MPDDPRSDDGSAAEPPRKTGRPPRRIVIHNGSPIAVTNHPDHRFYESVQRHFHEWQHDEWRGEDRYFTMCDYWAEDIAVGVGNMIEDVEADIGERPSRFYQLRPGADGNYRKGNVEWKFVDRFPNVPEFWKPWDGRTGITRKQWFMWKSEVRQDCVGCDWETQQVCECEWAVINRHREFLDAVGDPDPEEATAKVDDPLSAVLRERGAYRPLSGGIWDTM